MSRHLSALAWDRKQRRVRCLVKVGILLMVLGLLSLTLGLLGVGSHVILHIVLP